jgi:hypothetical protein
MRDSLPHPLKKQSEDTKRFLVRGHPEDSHRILGDSSLTD